MNTVNVYSPVEETPFDSFKRFAQVVPAGLAITLILVLGMERLIATNAIDVATPPEWVVPNPIAEPREPPPVERANKPEKIKPPEPVPELPEFTPAVDTAMVQGPPDFTPDAGPPTSEIGNYASDAPIATVLVQPEYPARALTKGIEGFVDVRFDVTARGSTDNIQITLGMPERIFDRAAIKAVKKWKFQPMVADGKAVPYAGLEQRITFQLEQ